MLENPFSQILTERGYQEKDEKWIHPESPKHHFTLVQDPFFLSISLFFTDRSKMYGQSIPIQSRDDWDQIYQNFHNRIFSEYPPPLTVPCGP